jgi:hypothetical protein
METGQIQILTEKPNSPYLWRYMNISKFLSFIQSDELYFSSLNKMNDVLEGANFADSVFINLYFNMVKREKLGYNGKFIAEIQKLKEIQRSVLACCFFSKRDESKVMFDVYSSENGLAICFDSNKLFEQIKIFYENNLLDKFKFGYGYINYSFKEPLGLVDLISGTRTIKLNPFAKQNIHSYEEEYRFILYTENPKFEHLKIKIDPSSIIKIVAHPNLFDWEIDVINNAVKKYHDKLYLRKSKLITNETLNRIKEGI